MSAHLDEEHEMIRSSLREFLEEEIQPDLPEADREAMSKDEAIQYQQMLGELGIGPGSVEGEGFDDPLTYAVTSEEISRIWPSLNVTLNMSFPTIFARYAGEETQDALRDRLDEGSCIGCMAVTEPDGGSDTAHPGTTATKDGDEYVIDGEKTWVSNAPIADMALVVAYDEDAEQRDFFIVDTVTNDVETRELHKLGWKGSPTGQIFFDEVRVPEDNKLMNAVTKMIASGESDITDNEMFQNQNPLNAMFAYMRTGMAAMSVGIMQAAYEAALDYSKDREVFGGPIGGHQLVQEKLYEIRAGLETGRLLTYEAARKVAAGDDEARMYSSLAKGWVCEKSVDVADVALQVYGGNGLSKDYPLERYYRDARTMTIPDGTTDIQQLVVGKELTGIAAYK
ncbi:acyl-CoA/acyl-ACP dehydrogenase [Natronomonas salina]|uniref:acyl-CoA dehydrogenase family protein n=1 Tax=Natronomonas salina TaxID=1710540 RepID=UPI0015B62224|nr:acyl-CoA dehydrogenase family protein [Natronomonas salina]QLD88054.1 acyl-CoA/acyl-ACP dehydrogenase [Natronomonas salina]